MLRRFFRDPLFNWALAFQVAFIASVTVWKVSANTLIIARSDTDFLPLLYLLSAFTTGLVALASGRGTGRARTSPPILMFTWAIGISLLFFGGLKHLGPAGLSALYLASEAYATLVSLRFWEAMGNAFNARQARQKFTVLGAAGMVGAMLGGLLSSGLSREGVRWLIPAGALLALGAMYASREFKRRVPVDGSVARRARPKKVGPGDAFRYLRNDPYPRGLALCAVLLAALTAVVDYHFRRRAGETLGERELASLFGWLNLAVGLTAVAVQMGLSQRILARFGIFRYLMAPPLGVAVSSALSFLVPGLWPVFTEKTIENAGSFSITQSGFQLLYNPIPPELQGSLRGLIDGLMKKGGFALGGLVLLILGTQSTDRALTGLALATAVGCALALARQKSLYVRALAQRISLDPKDRLVQGNLDADARGLLMEELFSPETHRVLNALEMLRQDESFEVRPFLATLLDHPSERVREVGVRLARQTRASELAPRLIFLAESDKDRRPRDEAVRALATVLPEAEAVARLRVFLTSPDPGLRAAATEALFRLGGSPRTEAEAALSDALTGTTPAERREAARLLGRLRTPDAAARLLVHLGDDDASVRNVACAAAAELKSPELIEPLFELLPPRATRRAARDALIAYGPAVLAAARARLDDRSQPLPLRLEMPKLLRGIGTEQAAEILLFSNIDDDAFLRYRIGIALSRWRQQNPTLAVDSRRIREAILRRVASYDTYAPVYADVAAGLGETALLSRALAGRLEQNAEITFQLLGLIYPQRMLLSSYRRFASNAARERAQAVELVDSLVDDELRRAIMPMLEAEIARRSGLGPAGRATALPGRLVELANSRDTILQGLAWSVAQPADGEGVKLVVSTLGLEKVLLLEGVDIFSGCSVDDLTALAQIAGERNFVEGEYIYSEGDPGETLFVIVDGQVRILKQGTMVLKLGSREAFGSVSLIDGAPRPADAVAASAVRTLAIDRGDFLDLVSDRPELLKGVFNVVTGQLRRMIEVAARANATAA